MRHKLVLGPLSGYIELSGNRPRREVYIAVHNVPLWPVWESNQDVEKLVTHELKFVWYGDWDQTTYRDIPVLLYQHEDFPKPARKPDWTTIDVEGYAVGQHLPGKKEIPG